MSNLNREEISIYIHWPFCLSKCPYCDFNSHAFSGVDDYVWQKAYLQDIEFFSNKIKNKYIKSIFFGGGTPSLMNPNIVEAIIKSISTLGTIDQFTEITLEANPTSIEINKLISFKSAGINRVSLGVQSFNDEELKFLGRQHSAEEAKRGLEIIKKHFDHFSFDLIYGLPKQNLQTWSKALEKAMPFFGKHISLYQLTIERGTPFFYRYHKGEFQLPDNTLLANMYEYTTNVLKDVGLNRYEISNYAVNKYESIHNLTYWRYDEYLGIGPGAHSRIHENNDIYSMWMVYQPDTWLKQTNTKFRIKHKKRLSKIDIFKEMIMMNLRITEGIFNRKIQKIFEKDMKEIIDFTPLYSLQDDGMLTITNDNIALTNKGMLICDHIVKIMFDLYKG